MLIGPLIGWCPVPEQEARALPSSPEPTRKPFVALALCGAVLVLPLALSGPGGAPKTEEVVLAAGAPDPALAEEPASGEAGVDAIGGADGGVEEEVVLDEEASLTPTGVPTSLPAAIASRRPARAAAKAAPKATATTRKSTSTTTATAARAAAAPTTTEPPPPPPPPPPAPAPVVGGGTVWDKLAECESGNTNDPGAPYYGYWQFSEPTWLSVGETGLPDEHSRDRQLAAAKRLQASRGWAPWPECSRRLGLT